MRTGVQGVVRGIGYFNIQGQLVITCTTTPGAATVSGAAARFVKTCTYSATGIYTIVFGDDFQGTSNPVFDTEAQGATLATDWFQTIVVGGYNATTKTVVIQCHRSGTAQAPAATAGNQIVVNIGLVDSQGK